MIQEYELTPSQQDFIDAMEESLTNMKTIFVRCININTDSAIIIEEKVSNNLTIEDCLNIIFNKLNFNMEDYHVNSETKTSNVYMSCGIIEATTNYITITIA